MLRCKHFLSVSPCSNSENSPAAAVSLFAFAVSIAGCKGAASQDFGTLLVDCWSILGFRGSLEWPWGPLVITCAPGPLKRWITGGAPAPKMDQKCAQIFASCALTVSHRNSCQKNRDSCVLTASHRNSRNSCQTNCASCALTSHRNSFENIVRAAPLQAATEMARP